MAWGEGVVIVGTNVCRQEQALEILYESGPTLFSLQASTAKVGNAVAGIIIWRVKVEHSDVASSGRPGMFVARSALRQLSALQAPATN